MIKYILLKDVLKQTKCENYKQREIWMWQEWQWIKEGKEGRSQWVSFTNSCVNSYSYTEKQFLKKFHLMHNMCMQTPIGS